MAEWTIKYWLGVIFGAATALGTKMFQKRRTESRQRKQMEKEVYDELIILREEVSTSNATVNQIQQEITQLRNTDLIILHDRLYQACQFFIAQGEISVADLENVEYIYAGYSALGGNGTGTELYKRTKKLPLVVERSTHAKT